MSSRTWNQGDELKVEAENYQHVPWSRRFVGSLVERFQEGQVSFHDCWGVMKGGLEGSELLSQVSVHDPAFYRRLVSGGVLGVAESYARGEWSCPALTDLFRLLLKNARVLRSVQQRLHGIPRMISSLRHWLNRNHRHGSRKNIHQHYDLGNDFFQLFLDETLNYSSAVFAGSQQSLADASRNKMEMICEKLALSPQDHVLEIGSGWGALAIWMANYYGCRVTTTTISEQQFHYASQQVERMGLAGKVQVLRQDYRDLQGNYDKLVSVEMIEAVGHRYLSQFFQQCNRLIRPSGKMLLQVILTQDDHYNEYLRHVDFIRTYIFPGGSLPCYRVIDKKVRESTDLRVEDREDITVHYQRTLRCWRLQFENQLKQIKELGFDERFIRIWRYYLCYCEAGFAERHSTTEQIVFVK